MCVPFVGDNVVLHGRLGTSNFDPWSSPQSRLSNLGQSKSSKVLPLESSATTWSMVFSTVWRLSPGWGPARWGWPSSSWVLKQWPITGKRFVYATQGFPWCMFDLLDKSMDEFIVQYNQFREQLSQCECCEDASLAEDVAAVKAMLKSISTRGHCQLT